MEKINGIQAKKYESLFENNTLKNREYKAQLQPCAQTLN